MSEIEILAYGLGWMAVNKPSGVSSHNDQGADLLALAKSAMEQRPDLRSQTGFTDGFAPSPVHRLDRETSGVVLLATTSLAASFLGKAIENRQVKKLYVAVLRGTFTQSEGKWSEPLSDRAEGRKNPRGSSSERKACETGYKILSKSPHLSLVECDLLTGRQHQIRRHAVLDRHQVVGDERYGDPKYVMQMANRYGCSRLYLHASRLEFANPAGGPTIEISCPAPPEFLELVEKSRIGPS